MVTALLLLVGCRAVEATDTGDFEVACPDPATVESHTDEVFPPAMYSSGIVWWLHPDDAECVSDTAAAAEVFADNQLTWGDAEIVSVPGLWFSYAGVPTVEGVVPDCAAVERWTSDWQGTGDVGPDLGATTPAGYAVVFDLAGTDGATGDEYVRAIEAGYRGGVYRAAGHVESESSLQIVAWGMTGGETWKYKFCHVYYEFGGVQEAFTNYWEVDPDAMTIGLMREFTYP